MADNALGRWADGVARDARERNWRAVAEDFGWGAVSVGFFLFYTFMGMLAVVVGVYFAVRTVTGHPSAAGMIALLVIAFVVFAYALDWFQKRRAPEYSDEDSWE